MISNIYNMDMGDPLTPIPLWLPFKYIFLFLNWPFAWSGLNVGRISMWTNGYIKNNVTML
jgi:hypothetical protein